LTGTRPSIIFTGMSASAPAVGTTENEIHWLRLLCGTALLVWTLALACRDNPWSFLDWINLAFHEAGHLFLLPFGETLHFLGGTILQLAIPLGLTVHFLLKRSPFSASGCFWWFGQNFLGTAYYMADARELKLPLVGGGENDWNHLFYEWGLLGEDSVNAVSTITRGTGLAIMSAACLWMIFLALPAAQRDSLAGPMARRFPVLFSQSE
jgi:hypothetical protein